MLADPKAPSMPLKSKGSSKDPLVLLDGGDCVLEALLSKSNPAPLDDDASAADAGDQGSFDDAAVRNGG